MAYRLKVKVSLLLVEWLLSTEEQPGEHAGQWETTGSKRDQVSGRQATATAGELRGSYDRKISNQWALDISTSTTESTMTAVQGQ